MRDWLYVYGGVIVWGIISLLYIASIISLPWLLGVPE